MPRTRRELVFFILGGFFLTNALLGEMTGGKLFVIDWGWFSAVLPLGVLPWPVVFITTDLVNEYYGRDGVRKLTFLALLLIVYAFGVLFLAILVPAWEHSPVSYDAFAEVFGQSMWIIVGSLTAFLVSQFVDVLIFSSIKRATGHRMLWLRATGSTVVSQFVDTFVVQAVAFVLPGKLTIAQVVPIALSSYAFKLCVAILITPIIYLAHGVVDRYLRGDEPALLDAPAVPRALCPHEDCGADLPAAAMYCPACGRRVTSPT